MPKPTHKPAAKPPPPPVHKPESTGVLDHINQAAKQEAKTTKVPGFLSKLVLRRPGKKTKIVLTALLVPLAILALAVLASAYPAYRLSKSLPRLEASAREAYTAAKSQDLVTAKDKLSQTKLDFETVAKNYRLLAWYKFTPLRWHYQDGERLIAAGRVGLESGSLLVDTIEPYADVLGFTGEGTFAGGTTEDRIIKILETLGKVTPAFDQISQNLQTVNHELSQINPNRYPFSIKSRQVPELIKNAQAVANTASTTLDEFRPLIEVLPAVAGLEDDRRYLIMFQNDAEIRATGGFMTAYGIVRIDKGRVFQERSDDIYSLDEQFNSRLKPPEAIQKYLPLVFYWHLRDMNMSPDFKTSMDTFLEHYQTLPNPPDDLDGIIAVDTQVLTDLIRVLGPIEVPGFDTYTAEIDPRCDCPQVIYELEDFATRPVAYVRDDRKAFLVPMMQTIIAKAYGAPKNVWPNLFQTVIGNIQQKHVIFYLFDDAAQQAVEQSGIAGRIVDTDTDYLHINDTNFGGAKSNLFITEEIQDAITTTDSGTSHELSVTYKNPAPASNCNLEAGQLCLNGTYRDYVRFYLPLGSTVTESLGFQEDSVKTYDELGKTVVEGFFQFAPQSQAKLKLIYTTPYKPQDSQYRFLIQKQPGKKTPQYTLTFNGVDQQQFSLATDQEITFDLE